MVPKLPLHSARWRDLDGVTVEEVTVLLEEMAAATASATAFTTASAAAPAAAAPAASAPAASAPAEPAPAPSTPASSTVEAYGRCGGIGYTGSTQCAQGWTCKVQNDYYSQCLQGNSRRDQTIPVVRRDLKKRNRVA